MLQTGSHDPHEFVSPKSVPELQLVESLHVGECREGCIRDGGVCEAEMHDLCAILQVEHAFIEDRILVQDQDSKLGHGAQMDQTRTCDLVGIQVEMFESRDFRQLLQADVRNLRVTQIQVSQRGHSAQV